MLVRNRPTPGTPMAKSASLRSANSLTWRGVMICSARVLRSSGLSGAISSGVSTPLRRTVGARPTLSSRSEPLRWTRLEMACLKLKGAAAGAASAIGIDPEEHLAELDRLGVVHADFRHDAGKFGLDFIHDLHCFDDADRLPRGDPGTDLGVGLGAR